MLFRSPFWEGISCAPAALGLLWPWTDTAALETEGLHRMRMLCSKHLKYSAISPWGYLLCAPRVTWRNLRASWGKRPHWKPWRTLRAQGAKEGTVSHIASKWAKPSPKLPRGSVTDRNGWIVPKKAEDWPIACAVWMAVRTRSRGDTRDALLLCSLA